LTTRTTELERGSQRRRAVGRLSSSASVLTRFSRSSTVIDHVLVSRRLRAAAEVGAVYLLEEIRFLGPSAPFEKNNKSVA